MTVSNPFQNVSFSPSSLTWKEGLRLTNAYIVKQWQDSGMLRYADSVTGRMVCDRLPLRQCAEGKNCRNRYQVLSADQSQCWLFRSLKLACQFANGQSVPLSKMLYVA